MKKAIFTFGSILLALTLMGPGAYAKGRGAGKSTGSHSKNHSKSTEPVQVKGHEKKDGTYIAPHRRTRPNKTKQDNWSTKGNVNPDTGKEGTKDPY